MRAQELIDKALRYGDNVSPTSADYLERRRLALSFLRDLVDEVWWLRDWPWKKKDTTVTVPANVGYTNLPVDFSSLGNYGGVYSNVDGGKLDEVPESVIEDLKSGQNPWSTANPQVFALHGQDETTYLGQIKIPLNSTAVTLKIFYQSNPPFIMDAGDPDSAGADPATSLTFDPVTGLVTVDMTDHGFASGQLVEVSNASDPLYDGGPFVVTVQDEDTFTFPLTTTPAAPATGDVGYALTAADRAILRIPEKHHQTVLLWGLRSHLRESKGDARYEYAKGEFAKGLTHMLREHARAQGSMRQLPGFFGAMRRG